MNAITLERFCGLIKERSGLCYEGAARLTLERRLLARAGELALSTPEEYFGQLQADSKERDALFERLTTKETYFFRQEYQLKAFAEELLPRMAKESGGQGRLTIWSAGCSSGEESYTLAMLILESRLFRSDRVRILGTDLCLSNVEAASKGVYRKSSFRATSEERRRKFFEREAKGFRVKREVRTMVHFSVGNLVEARDLRAVGRVDVIFCRNVLIYFDPDSRKKVIDLFLERLLPGGYLLLGHSESLLNVKTDFEPVHLEKDMVYRRPLIVPARRSGSEETS